MGLSFLKSAHIYVQGANPLHRYDDLPYDILEALSLKFTYKAAESLRNISIPSSAFDDTRGSFGTVLNLATHQRSMISMSVAAGGISDLLTVREPRSGESCNTTDPGELFLFNPSSTSYNQQILVLGVDFFFSLDADLKQCE